MNYTYQDFKPLNPIIEINDLELSFSILNLDHINYFEANFKSIQGALDSIKEKPENLIRIIWRLLIEKSYFNFKYREFYNFFLSEKITERASLAYKILSDCISLSMPMIKNEKRFQEIQKIKKAQSDNQSSITCYANLYDIFANRYGYTIDQFYSLTVRQIHILLEKQGINQHKDLEIQAALMGKQLKQQVTFNEFTEEEEALNENQAQEAFEKLRQDYLKNKDKK